MTKLPFRYFNGEQECPYQENDKRHHFWLMERNLSHFLDGRVEEIFGETNPVNWPPFMEKAKGTFQELAVAYVMWMDYAVHVWGGDEGGLGWLKYFEQPVIAENSKERMVTITRCFSVKPDPECPCEGDADEEDEA